MKLFVLSFLFFCWNSFAAFQPEPIAYTMEEGRTLFIQIIEPPKKDSPTFLFLPGVNRSVLADEAAVQNLVSKGYGAVTFNLSVQPLSVALLDADTAPFFRSNELTLADFALETESLAKSLEKKYGIKHLIPVSLSYSGAVSAYLKDFPVTIETAPMTSNAVVNPQMEQYRQSLIALEIFNPFFGPSITRATLDNLYRSNWQGQVSAISSQYGLPGGRHTDMVEGYTMMSRAAEDSDWKNVEMDPTVRRIFVIGGNEAEDLKRHQIETFLSLSDKSKSVMFIVEESGHIVPFDQPKIYAEILEMAAKNELPKSRVVRITPSLNEWSEVSGSSVEDFLQ